tara:strand:- start:2490 stop:2723 length:234 start_codon:yes stop_codon:yes gene_type:complete
MVKKPTWKATEFWVTLIGVLGGIIMSVLPESPTANIVGGLLAAICGGSYTMGRSMVKSSESKSEAIKAAVKKKSSKG